MIKQTFLCSAALLLCACGGARSATQALGNDKAPAWVMNPPQSTQFLYGAGQAALGERASAVDQARKDLSAQIQISINAARSEQILINVQKTKDSMVERLDKAVDDQVRTQVKLSDLPGITIEQQVDAKKFTYALVKMDRVAWANSIRLEVVEVDAKIESTQQSLEEELAKNLDALQQAMLLYKELVPLFSKREILQDRYRLAAPQSSLPACPVDEMQIRATLAAHLKDVTVSLPSDPSVSAFIPALIEACASRGLQVVNDPQQAMLNLDFKVSEVKRLIDGNVKLEGTAAGSVVDRSSGRFLGALEARAAAGSSSEESARRQLLQRLGKQIAAALEEQLFTYLTRL